MAESIIADIVGIVGVGFIALGVWQAFGGGKQ
jgi:hypothetical protein